LRLIQHSDGDGLRVLRYGRQRTGQQRGTETDARTAFEETATIDVKLALVHGVFRVKPTDQPDAVRSITI
jgi:hypothetical protein